MNKAANAYFQTGVNTTDQGNLLLMLYDGALRYLQQARDKMIAKDYAGKGILISRVIDIVNELSGSLNMEKGGSLAVNLNNLYILCTARLLQANLKMNVESLDSVVGILSGLRSAYAQILDTPEAKKASQQIAQRLQPAATATRRAQPVMPPMQNGVPVSRVAARAAYGRMQMPTGTPATVSPAATAATPSVQPTTPAAPQTVVPQTQANAPAAPQQARAHVQQFDQAAMMLQQPVSRIPNAYARG